MRIAILLVGLVRTFRKTYPTLQAHILEKYPEHSFDFFCTTWNIKGDVTKDKTIYKVNQHSQKWLNDSDLVMEDDLNLLKELYSPKFFRVINYSKWKLNSQNKINSFISKFKLEKQRNFVEQSLFSQYFAINLGFKDFEEYCQRENISYDLVIKSRYDLAYGDQDIDWQRIFELVNEKNKLISLKNWIPKGISDQIIIGNVSLMKKYTELYPKLSEMTHQDINSIKLLTFYLGDIYMHFDCYQPGMDPEKFYQENYDRIKKNMIDYLEWAHEFITPIIAERLLLYFLNKIQDVDVHYEEFMEILLVRNEHNLVANNMSYLKSQSGDQFVK